MKNINLAEVIKFLVYLGLVAAIECIWVFMEIIEFGHDMPSYSDLVIGLLFAWSLYSNLHIVVRRGEKHG